MDICYLFLFKENGYFLHAEAKFSWAGCWVFSEDGQKSLAEVKARLTTPQHAFKASTKGFCPCTGSLAPKKITPGENILELKHDKALCLWAYDCLICLQEIKTFTGLKHSYYEIPNSTSLGNTGVKMYNKNLFISNKTKPTSS